jgi:Domain of unknown function (DUF222)/HNH endonuclease
LREAPVCDPGQQLSPAAALAAVTAGLAAVAGADLTGLTAGEQADLLRGLGVAEARVVAARSAVLAAFGAARGYEADGAGSARSWLRWQTRVTPQAASGAAGWARRLAAHPDVAAALAAGVVSPSWARCICEWTSRLPVFGQQHDADKVLLAAAAGGAELADLAGLAGEITRRCAGPDQDRDGEGDGFRDRDLKLAEYWQGSGLVQGNLTPECAAALRAVLDSLNGRAGPGDHRTAGQRDHDALHDALTRLLAARCLPERGGQPAQVLLHMTLDQLLGQPGAPGAAAEWAGYGAAAPPGTECDATIVPVVTGHLDPGLLDQLAAALLPPATPATGTGPAASDGGTGTGTGTAGWDVPGVPGRAGSGAGGRFGFGTGLPAWAGPGGIPAWATPFRAWKMTARPAPAAGTAARELILTRAARLLSGPHGLAAWLRHQLTDGPAASISQVLDIGIPTEIIPPHLRRAVVLRDRHCSFPGCHRPPAACQVHHITPRSQGGVTSLGNCALLCPFHHLIAIHRWGWQFRLNPDGTKTVTSPDGRIYHTHSPPAGWAA